MYFCFQGEEFAIQVPQEAHCFTLEPDTVYSIRVSTEEENHSEIYMRVYSKGNFVIPYKTLESD
jgi:hypothetical protein